MSFCLSISISPPLTVLRSILSKSFYETLSLTSNQLLPTFSSLMGSSVGLSYTCVPLLFLFLNLSLSAYLAFLTDKSLLSSFSSSFDRTGVEALYVKFGMLLSPFFSFTFCPFFVLSKVYIFFGPDSSLVFYSHFLNIN
jgi:hypothetical protein